MQTGFLHLHSTISYIVVALLAISFIAALMGLQKGTYKPLDHKLGLFTMIFAHIQLLVGLGMYMMSDMVQANVTRYKFEHPVLMILGIVFITIAFSKTKRMEDAKKKQKVKVLLYAGALLIIMARIPWF